MGTARPWTFEIPSRAAFWRRREIISLLTSTPSTVLQRLASVSVTCPEPQPRSTANASGSGSASLRTRAMTLTRPGLFPAPWSQVAARRVQKRCWRAMFLFAPAAWRL